MDNGHGDNMEKNSSQAGKEASPENSRQEISDGDRAAREDLSAKKPGAILAAKRIEAGISEEQIAARLKMTLRQVHYLETDNYDALHGISISRGFVRAYARVLKIDPDPLVALFGEQTDSSARIKAPVQKSGEKFVQNRVPFRKKGNMAGKLIVALIVLVIAAIIAWNMKLFSFEGRQGKKEMPETIVPKAQVQPSPQDIRQTDSPVEALPGQSTGSAVSQSVQPVHPDNGNANMASQTAVIGNSQAEPVSVTAQPESVGTATAVGKAKSSLLTIAFREKSWIQIQRQDGSVITEYVGKAGEQRQLEVTEPVTVIIGFAPGVSMEFRGTPVDLASNTVNSVARISLK